MTDTRYSRAGGDQGAIQRAQRGDRRAFLDLYERHAPQTWRLALVAGRDRPAAEAAVVRAFAEVLGRADRLEAHRFAPVGDQLLHEARETAVEQAARVAEPAGLDALADSEHHDTWLAFDRLPERWRSVLWLDQIERAPLSTTALALGTPEASTAGLGTRALAGLGEQLVQLKVHPDLKRDCRQTTLRLNGYVTSALPSRDTIRVRRHLDRCEGCRARLDELDDVTAHLRGALPALPIAIESLAMGAWFARTHEGAGPIGLRLPGGALAPAWLERTLAGATAAVVSLGISAAVLLNARDGASPAPIESAAARGEGEQALAGDATTDDGATDGPTVLLPDPSLTTGGASTSGDVTAGAASSGSDATAPAAGAGATPRGSGAPSAPQSPGGSTPTPGPTPTPPPAPAPDDATDPPSASDPVGDVVDAVDIVVDDVCGGLGPVCDVLPTATSLPPIPGL